MENPVARVTDSVTGSVTDSVTDSVTGSANERPSDLVDDLDELVDEWLTLPDIAERLDLKVTLVRRLLQERQLVAVRRGPNNVLSVPAKLVGPEGPLPELPGTLTVLADSGYQGESALRWLFTPDESITGGTPIDALLAGHKTEVRRRAQALAV